MGESKSQPDRPDDLVIAPGGPKPRERVHPVGPGQAVRRLDGDNYVVVPEETHPDPARRPIMSDELVLTPGGFRPRSLVHKIEPGHYLDTSTGRFRQHDRTGKLVADHGPMIQRPGGKPLMPTNVTREPGPAPALGTGWIVYASWTNNTGRTITSFKTTWVVPPPPATQSGQTIFLFNGIQNSTMIYQPVLQWGPSAAGGGNNWAVAS